MTPRLIPLLLLLLSACAHREPPLPTCDGSERRPANPHGSVLVGTPPPAAPAGDPAPTPSPAAGGCA